MKYEWSRKEMDRGSEERRGELIFGGGGWVEGLVLGVIDECSRNQRSLYVELFPAFLLKKIVVSLVQT